MEFDLCKDGLWLRLSRSGAHGCMTMLQRQEDEEEVILTGFDFGPGDLEAVTQGIGYQQSTPEGVVHLSSERSGVEVSFRSKETGRAHGCRIDHAAFDELLAQVWGSPVGERSGP